MKLLKEFTQYNYPIVHKAFEMIVEEKLESDGYFSMEPYVRVDFSMKDMRSKLKDSFLFKLYQHTLEYDVKKSEVLFAEMFANFRVYDEDCMEEYEADAILLWIFRSMGNVGRRRQFIEDNLSMFGDYEQMRLIFDSDIIYDDLRIELCPVASVSDFARVIKEIRDAHPREKLFYRGHDRLNYLLIPSVMRSNAWAQNERKMYYDLKIRCTDDFADVNTHFDYLVKMQHYGLPTRLLDITTNPLVALYFACSDQKEKMGEVIIFSAESDKIKYPDSDSATVIASLPLFKYEEQMEMYQDSFRMAAGAFNVKHQRLLHEIKKEKPAFRDEIEVETIRKDYFIVSEKKNKRILKQDGEFIICGLEKNEYVKSKEISRFRVREKGKIRLCVCVNKKDILEELEVYSINSATLFPEIENVAAYIKLHTN